jgi:hypothetical protein
MARSWEFDEEHLHSGSGEQPHLEDEGEEEEEEDEKDEEEKIWEDPIDTPEGSDAGSGNPTEIFIAVMGLTGSGKSLFIKTLTRAEIVVGSKLESCKFASG